MPKSGLMSAKQSQKRRGRKSFSSKQRSAWKKKKDVAEHSLLGGQRIHPWNGHGYFCGQVDIDGKFIQTKECMKKEELSRRYAAKFFAAKRFGNKAWGF